MARSPFRAAPALVLACLLAAMAAMAARMSAAEDHAPAVLPRTMPVAEAANGIVVLRPETALPLAFGGRLLARVSVPPTALPVLSADKTGPAHRLLRRLYETGQAAGNRGDLYDNRDRAHARLDPLSHPQLTHIRYGRAFRDKGLDYGLALGLLFETPVIGNSSTALTRGPLWRSQPRLAMTSPGGASMRALYRNYRTGQIHVYPEHRDHDPERGDLFPANTPYMLISQGSSGSDLAHLEALAMILAALRPDTKTRAMEAGVLAPLVQMIYRRSRLPVRARADYLSGPAHPGVFRAQDISLARLVSLANAIAPDEIPPMVRLNVLDETKAREGIDYFGEDLSETLFDTPSAVARIWRSGIGRRQMLVSADTTTDPNGRDLRFDWVLLRGDPERVAIVPLGEDGRQARITIDWQDPRPVPGAPDLTSPRVDIGVFANNGLYDSAPAFISVLLPEHEARAYAPGDPLRPVRIDRRATGMAYADPLIFPAMDWRDVYLYDETGQPAGWIRYRDGNQSAFDARGRRLSPQDGQPVTVRYQTVSTPSGRTRLSEEPRPGEAE